MFSVSLNNISSFCHFLVSKRSIPIYKATLAYLLYFVFVFLRRFDDLNQFPITFASGVIVLLVGGPGKSVGGCIQSTFLALAGVGLGSVFYIIQCKIVESPVSQGFVFAVVVYIASLVKAASIKYFSFALLWILQTFSGIQASISNRNADMILLQEYLKAYCWAAAIVLAVNICIFPMTSEKELRRTLLLSLEHISTFSHLLAKSYTLEITAEEMAVREHLAESIRADFGYLNQKIDETSIEVNYSRFSMEDYQSFVTRTRGIQLALITSYSSLVNVQKKDLGVTKSHFLPNTIKSFTALRRALQTTIQEISVELGCKALSITSEQADYAQFMDIERQNSEDDLSQRKHTSKDSSVDSVEEKLAAVSKRLANEVGDDNSTDNAVGENIYVSPEVHVGIAASEVNLPVSVTNEETDAGIPVKDSISDSDTVLHTRSTGYCVRSLRRVYERFAADQHDNLVNALVDGKLHGEDDTLLIFDPMPSIHDVYNYQYVPLSDASSVHFKRRRRIWMNEGDDVTFNLNNAAQYYSLQREKKTQHEKRADEVAAASHYSLARAYSFLFATEQFVNELEHLYSTAKQRSRHGFHIHIFEMLHRPHRTQGNEAELSVSEALALLERTVYTPVKMNIFQRFEKIELWFRSPISVFAFKTAAATSVFSVLILHPSPRPWFLSFGLLSGALTIVTALTPTLGQSLLAFILQIAGSGFGYIWALTLLEIFKNVGGYHFNPYGIVALMIPYAITMLYILYEMPQYFVAALLALNGTGVLLVTEYSQIQYAGNTQFDSPPLRFAKSMTSLGVALALTALFQLFILRNPARRTLRKRIGALIFSQLSYLTLLQAFARATMPSESGSEVPDIALARVEKELKRREIKLQTELISLRPMVQFAAAEPQFSRPFPVKHIKTVLKSSQVLLDRMRESRTAIGTKRLPEVVYKRFIQVLNPYRRRNTQLLQLTFYLVATSIVSKSPLPRETPAELDNIDHRGRFMHDTLVLSAEYARTKEGAKVIRSGEFTRYFHYLICITSLMDHLKTIEDACRDLNGELEDKVV